MKIYFLHTGLLSFVRKDLSILETAHEVRAELNFHRALRNSWRNVRGVFWCDQLFCWFASINYFPAVILARLLRRRVVLVAGGFDVADMPELGYGSMRGGVKTALVRLMLRLADRVISVSESNRIEALKNGKVDPVRNVMIYHGFTGAPVTALPKEQMVVTVGEVKADNLKRKGLEDFVRLAAFFPDVPFKLVGSWSDDTHQYLRKISTGNVEIMGFVESEVLHDLLGRAKVYLQPSRHEGFGCSVAEAMLHRCVPVVSDAFALPEVVGDCGYTALPGDLDGFRSALGKALDSEAALGESARERIVRIFPLEQRAKRLLEVVNDA